MLVRSLVGLSFILGALSACAPSQPLVVRSTGAPAYSPTHYVELLEAKPARPYQEIGVIDVAGAPGSFRTQVLERVKAQAQQLGADAVILQDLSRTTPAETRLNPTTGAYESAGGQLIPAFKGTAIKYR